MKQKPIIVIAAFIILFLHYCVGFNITTDFFTESEKAKIFVPNISTQLCLEAANYQFAQIVNLSPLIQSANKTYPSSSQFCISAQGQLFLGIESQPLIWLTPIEDTTTPILIKVTATSATTQLSKIFAVYGRHTTQLQSLNVSPVVLFPLLLKDKGLYYALELTPVPPLNFSCSLSLLTPQESISSLASTAQSACVFSSIDLLNFIYSALKYDSSKFSTVLQLKDQDSKVIAWSQMWVQPNPQVTSLNPLLVKFRESSVLRFELSSGVYSSASTFSCYCTNIATGRKYDSTNLALVDSNKTILVTFSAFTLPPSSTLQCSLLFQGVTVAYSSNVESKVQTFSFVILNREATPAYSFTGLDNATVGLEINTDMPNISSTLCLIANLTYAPSLISANATSGIHLVKCKLPFITSPSNISIALITGDFVNPLIASYPILPSFFLNSYEKTYQSNLMQVNLTSLDLYYDTYATSLSNAFSLMNKSSFVCAFEIRTTYTTIKRTSATWISSTVFSCNSLLLVPISGVQTYINVWLEDSNGRNISRNRITVSSNIDADILSIYPSVVSAGSSVNIFVPTLNTSKISVCYLSTTSPAFLLILSCDLKSQADNAYYVCPTPGISDIFRVVIGPCNTTSLIDGKGVVLWTTKGIVMSQLSPISKLVSTSPVLVVATSGLDHNMNKKLVCVLNNIVVTEFVNRSICNFTESFTKLVNITNVDKVTVYLATQEMPSIPLSNALQYDLVRSIIITPQRPFVMRPYPLLFSYTSSQQIGFTKQVLSCKFSFVDNVTGSSTFIVQSLNLLNSTHMECIIPDQFFTSTTGRLFLNADVSIQYNGMGFSNVAPVTIIGTPVNIAKYKGRVISSNSSGVVINTLDPLICEFESFITCSYSGIYKTNAICNTAKQIVCPITKMVSEFEDYKLSVFLDQTEISRVDSLIVFNQPFICSKLPSSIILLVDNSSSNALANITMTLPWESSLLQVLASISALRISSSDIFPANFRSDRSGYDFIINRPQQPNFTYNASLILDGATELFCTPNITIYTAALSLAISSIKPTTLVSGERKTISINLMQEIPASVDISSLRFCMDADCVVPTFQSNSSLTAVVSPVGALNAYSACYLTSNLYTTTREYHFIKVMQPPIILNVAPSIFYVRHQVTFTLTLDKLSAGFAHIYCTNGYFQTEVTQTNSNQVNCVLPIAMRPQEMYIGIQYDDLAPFYFSQSIIAVEPLVLVSTNATTVFSNSDPTYIAMQLANDVSADIAGRFVCVFEKAILTYATAGSTAKELICVHKYLTNQTTITLAIGANPQQVTDSITLKVISKPVLFRISPSDAYSVKEQTITFYGANLPSSPKAEFILKNGILNTVFDLVADSSSNTIFKAKIGELPEGDYEVRLIDTQNTLTRTNSIVVRIRLLPNLVSAFPDKEFASYSAAVQYKFSALLLTSYNYSCVFASDRQYYSAASVLSNVLSCQVPKALQTSVSSEQSFNVGIRFEPSIVWLSSITLYPYPGFSNIIPRNASSLGNSLITTSTNVSLSSSSAVYFKLNSSKSSYIVKSLSNEAQSISFKTPVISLQSMSAEIFTVSISLNGLYFITTGLELVIYPPIQIFNLSSSGVYSGQTTLISVFGRNLPTRNGYCKITDISAHDISSHIVVQLQPINETVAVCPVISTFLFSQSATIEISRNGIDFTAYNKSITIYAKRPSIASLNLSNYFSALDSLITITGDSLNSGILCFTECANYKIGLNLSGDSTSGTCYRPSMIDQKQECNINVIDSFAGTTLATFRVVFFRLPMMYTAFNVSGFFNKSSSFQINIVDLFKFPLNLTVGIGNNHYATCSQSPVSVSTFFNCTAPQINVTGRYPIYLSYNFSKKLISTNYVYQIIPEGKIISTNPSAILCGSTDLKINIVTENVPSSAIECWINQKVRSKWMLHVNSSYVTCYFDVITQSMCNDLQGWLSIRILDSLWTNEKFTTLIKTPAVIAVQPKRFIKGQPFQISIFTEGKTLISGLNYECVIGNFRYRALAFGSSALQCNVTNTNFNSDLEVQLSVGGYGYPIAKILMILSDLYLASAVPNIAYSNYNITLIGAWDSQYDINIDNIVCFTDSSIELPAIYNNINNITVNMWNLQAGTYNIRCSQVLGSYSNPVRVVILNKPQVQVLTPAIFLQGTDLNFTITGNFFVLDKTKVKLNSQVLSSCVVLNPVLINCSLPSNTAAGEYTLSISTNNGDQFVNFSSPIFKVTAMPILQNVVPSRVLYGMENVVHLTFNSLINNMGLKFWIGGQEVKNSSMTSNNSVLLRFNLSGPSTSYYHSIECMMNESSYKTNLNTQLTLADFPPNVNSQIIVLPQDQTQNVKISGGNLDLLYRPECKFGMNNGSAVSAVILNSKEIACAINMQNVSYLYVESQNFISFGPIPVLNVKQPNITGANSSMIFVSEANYVRLDGNNFIFENISNGILRPYFSCYYTVSGKTIKGAVIAETNTGLCTQIKNTSYCVKNSTICLITPTVVTQNPAYFYLENSSIRSNVFTISMYNAPVILSVNPILLIRDSRKLQVQYNTSHLISSFNCSLTEALGTANYQVQAVINPASSSYATCEWTVVIKPGKYTFNLVTNENRSSAVYPALIEIVQDEILAYSTTPYEWSTYMNTLPLTIKGFNLRSDFQYYVEVINSLNGTTKFNATYTSVSTISCVITLDAFMKNSSLLVLNVYANQAKINYRSINLTRVADILQANSLVFLDKNTIQTLVLTGSKLDSIKTCKFGIFLSTAYLQSDGSILCSVPSNVPSYYARKIFAFIL